MKELVEILAKALVDSPDSVVVKERKEEDQTVYELYVAPDDMGKVIGRAGRIAKSIRTVVKAAGIKTGENVTVEVMDPDKDEDAKDEADA